MDVYLDHGAVEPLDMNEYRLENCVYVVTKCCKIQTDSNV